MTKLVLSSVLIAAFSFAATAQELASEGKKAWECKARSEAGQVFTSRSTNRIWSKQFALDKCEQADQGYCWSAGCHKKAKDRD